MLIHRTYFLPTLVKIGTPRLRRLIVDVLPWKSIRKLRDIIDIMHNTSTEIFDAKKKALEEGNEAVSKQVGRGKDILSILSARKSSLVASTLMIPPFVVKANMDADEEDKLSEQEVLGQVNTRAVRTGCC